MRCEFTIPRPVKGKKNQKFTIWKDGRQIPITRKGAQNDIAMVTTLAIQAMQESLGLEGTGDVRATITHRIQSDEVHVLFETIREKPRGKTGRRRDLDNMATTILDACQGVVYHNDNQVADLRIIRDYRQ